MALLFGAVPVAVVCYKAFWAHGQGALGLGVVAVTKRAQGATGFLHPILVGASMVVPAVVAAALSAVASSAVASSAVVPSLLGW